MHQPLPKEIGLSFIGCGVMAESIVAGLLRKEIVEPAQIAASHPRADRREELQTKYGITVFPANTAAASAFNDRPNALFLCVKPQRLKGLLKELRPAPNDQTIVSIIAGSRIDTIAEAMKTRRVVRAMPNTPAQIGAGMTAWTCTDEVGESERAMVRTVLSALGKELFVETENMIDMATSLSATGPTYTFMVMEAMTDAGVHLGFSREVSRELVLQTMLGSVQFAIESHKHPAELRNMVTSPGGTSAEAIYQMEKGSLRTVLSKAIYNAYKRAVDLGKAK